MNYFTVALIALLICRVTSAQEVVDQWRYTLRRPAEGWRTPQFQADGWRRGAGGFGTLDTPGARVGTIWATNSIWLRKSFRLAAVPKEPALLVHHDENVEIYINGTNVAKLTIEEIKQHVRDAYRRRFGSSLPE